MPTREFWKEEPELLWAYQKMYMDSKKIQADIENKQAWLAGIYIYDAITVSLYNFFGREKGKPIKNYREKPIEFNKSKEEIEMEERLRIEEQIRERNREIKQILNKNK